MSTEIANRRAGPLAGLRVVEFAEVGPGPFCGMMLADMGADVIRVKRMQAADLGTKTDPRLRLTNRGRRHIAVDLKTAEGVGVVRALLARADALVEGFRPGVMERLGLGPAHCLALNPQLVYGRMTGWGQDGPLAQAAGHDINYLALTGVLHALGPANAPPTPPLSLLGDYAGGGMYLAFGILAAIIERSRSGLGQVVDAAIVDGVHSLATAIHGFRAAGTWRDERESNSSDGGNPWYAVYETSDGRYVAVGAIEERFYAVLVARMGLQPNDLPSRKERANWPRLKQLFADTFRQRTREEWVAAMEDCDACFAPVLTFAEAMRHPHNRARDAFVEAGGVLQPAPAPRLQRTPGRIVPQDQADCESVLAEHGYAADEIEALAERGIVGGGQ